MNIEHQWKYIIGVNQTDQNSEKPWPLRRYAFLPKPAIENLKKKSALKKSGLLRNTIEILKERLRIMISRKPIHNAEMTTHRSQFLVPVLQYAFVFIWQISQGNERSWHATDTNFNLVNWFA
jgi:hypothetical protein